MYTFVFSVSAYRIYLICTTKEVGQSQFMTNTTVCTVYLYTFLNKSYLYTINENIVYCYIRKYTCYFILKHYLIKLDSSMLSNCVFENHLTWYPYFSRCGKWPVYIILSFGYVYQTYIKHTYINIHMLCSLCIPQPVMNYVFNELSCLYIVLSSQFEAVSCSKLFAVNVQIICYFLFGWTSNSDLVSKECDLVSVSIKIYYALQVLPKLI